MSATVIRAYVPTRERPPKRTCGLQWDKGDIPSCLPDIGTYVRFKGGKLIGCVGTYEYYVKGQTTFPVVFPTGTQTMSMAEVEVVVPEARAPQHDNVAYINAARARRRANTTAGRCESAEAPKDGGSEISARGVC